MKEQKVVGIFLVKSNDKKDDVTVQSMMGNDAIHWMDYVNELHQMAEQFNCLSDYDFQWNNESIESFITRSFIKMASVKSKDTPEWNTIIESIKKLKQKVT